MAQPFATVAARALRTGSGKSDARRKLIMAVRAACRRLGLEDDDRKAIQLEVTGKASLADMNAAEMGAVLDRLNRDRPGGFSDRAHFANRPHVGKIRALWWTLYWLGDVEEPNDAALDAFVKRQTGLAALRFLDHSRAPSVIEALKAMAARGGVVWPSPEYRKQIAGPANPGLTIARLERHAVIQTLWQKLRQAEGVYGTDPYAFLSATLGGVLSLNHWCWDDRSLDNGIRALGKKWRRTLAAKAAE
jgi:phage gp16-like protein